MIDRYDQGSDEPRPAGPVPGGDHPSSGGVGEQPPPAPPAAGAPPAQGSGRDEDSAQGDAAQVEQDFEALLADAEREKAEYLELAKRTQADFENYRKRMAAEVQAAQERGKVAVAREVIDAVDNLERALEAGADEGSLAEGVRMVLAGLQETLARNGVEAVDPKGEKFDPQWHEALSAQPVEGAEPGLVVEVMQKGYKLGEQLVRPARVVVSA